MKLTVDVTPADIHDGEQGNCTLCPVALAVQRALHAYDPAVAWGAAVGPADVSVTRDDGGPGEQWTEILAPSAVAEFVARFDSWASVGPFTFTLDIPGHIATGRPS